MSRCLRRSTLVASALLAACAVAAPVASSSPNAFVKWRFEVDGQYILQRPAVAPDGNVAVASSSGTLYSLTPLGALRWSVPAVGGDGGPSIGPDGTVYVGRRQPCHRRRAGRDDQVDLRRLRAERDGGPDRRAGREHLRRLRHRGPWRRCPLTRGPAPVEQPRQSSLPRVRAARSRDRLRLGEPVRRVRRVRGGPDEHALPADAGRRAGLGRAGSDLQRRLHATPGPARDRPGRGPVPHRPEQPAGLVARPVQSGLGLGGVDVHSRSGERDVAARGWTGRVGLPPEASASSTP